MAERLSKDAVDAGIAETRQQINDAIALTRAQIAEHWIWYLLLGIVLVVGGLAAIAFPFFSGIAASIFLGWIFLITGVVMIVHAFSVGEWRGFLMNLLIGVLYVVAGGYLVLFPVASVITLTIVLAALLVADGILEMIMAFRLKSHEGWVWVLLSGLIALLAGGLIAMQLPSSATWAIGLVVGIKMLFSGWSFISLSLTSHPVDRPSPVVAN